MTHRLLLALLLLSGLSLTAFAETTTDTKATIPDQALTTKAPSLTDLSKPILIEQKADHKSNTFTIRLAANATTGFQWFLTGYDPDMMKPTKARYITNPSKMLGTPGISEWEFQLKPVAFSVPQVTHIQFEYRRPWEANFSSRQSLTIITQPAPVAAKDKDGVK